MKVSVVEGAYEKEPQKDDSFSVGFIRDYFTCRFISNLLNF